MKSVNTRLNFKLIINFYLFKLFFLKDYDEESEGFLKSGNCFSFNFCFYQKNKRKIKVFDLVKSLIKAFFLNF